MQKATAGASSVAVPLDSGTDPLPAGRFRRRVSHPHHTCAGDAAIAAAPAAPDGATGDWSNSHHGCYRSVYQNVGENPRHSVSATVVMSDIVSERKRRGLSVVDRRKWSEVVLTVNGSSWNLHAIDPQGFSVSCPGRSADQIVSGSSVRLA